jgi:hypothetical protein
LHDDKEIKETKVNAIDKSLFMSALFVRVVLMGELPVLGRRHAGMALEVFCEIAVVVKADQISYFRSSQIRLANQVFRVADSNLHEIRKNRLPVHPPEGSVQVVKRYVKLVFDNRACNSVAVILLHIVD